MKKAQALGAKVFAPPFDVMDAGRMAVLQDPTGAVFQVWQPKKHIGAKILNEPGALCWTELTTTRHEGGRSVLHAAVRLDAEAQRARRADGVHRVQRQRHAGDRHDGEAGGHAGAHPVVLDAVILPGRRLRRRRRESEGARRQGDGRPQDIPRTGRFAIVSDPQGAMFALFTRS